MFSWPLPLLLVLTVLASTTISILRGVYSKKYPMSGVYLWRFNFWQNIFCFAAILLIYLLSGSALTVSLFSVLLGVFLAIANIMSIEGLLKAQACGSFAYTNVIISLSSIIPSMCGPLFFNEKATVSQFIGIGLMVICIVLSPGKDDEQRRDVSLKWLLFCAVSFVFTGVTGVVQKVHQSSELHSSEMPALLLTCFLVSFLLSGLKLLAERAKTSKSDEKPHRITLPEFLFPALTGLGFAFPHTINLFLSGRLPTVILFPVVNLCPMMLVMLYAVLVFRERLTAKQWVGIGVGILSTVFVSGII